MKSNNRDVDKKVKNEATPKETVMIAGGSGFLGKACVKKLSESGFSIVSLYHNRLPEAIPNVFPVFSKLDAVDLLGAPLRGVSTVIYLVWEKPFLGDERLMDQNLGGDSVVTSNLAMLSKVIRAMEVAGTRRLIFVSAGGASRNAANAFLREKYLCENLIINSSLPEKIILRPSLIINGDQTNDRFVQLILEHLKRPLICAVPMAKTQIAPLHLDDFSNYIVNLVRVKLNDPCAIISLKGDLHYRLKDLFKLINQKMTHKNKVLIGGRWVDAMFSFANRQKLFAFSNKTEKFRIENLMSVAECEEDDLLKEKPLAVDYRATTQFF
jgi:uncharacterized protein YbjT (DUF2867 family)